MDANTVRIVITVLGFLCFIGICVWAFSKRAKKGFEEAANLPFTEDEEAAPEERAREKGRNDG